MTVTILSACYGGYDNLHPPVEQNIDVRWVMVTDGQSDVPSGWDHIVEPRPHLHPRMAAKIPKCLPSVYSDTDITIWLDASAAILRPDFAATCVDVLGNGDVAQWAHPQRTCILPEADVSLSMTKYTGQPVREQAAAYIAAGHPERFGLWASGCMAWRNAVETVLAGRDWLVEQTRWTYQDQLSWPWVVRRHRLDIREMPGGLWDRRFVAFCGHRSDL